MKSKFEKGFLIGLGLAALTREKATKIIKELEKKGEINKKEAKKLLTDFEKKVLQEHKTLHALIEKKTKFVISALGLATKKELRDLEARLKKKKK